MFSETNDQPNRSVTLLALALLVFAVFQLTQVMMDRMTLTKAKVQLEQNLAQADKALDDGAKMMDKLNDIAIGTQKLADAGNTNAKEIVNQLNKAGIKINPNFKKGQPPVPPSVNGAAPPSPAPAAPPAP